MRRERFENSFPKIVNRLLCSPTYCCVQSMVRHLAAPFQEHGRSVAALTDDADEPALIAGETILALDYRIPWSMFHPVQYCDAIGVGTDFSVVRDIIPYKHRPSTGRQRLARLPALCLWTDRKLLGSNPPRPASPGYPRIAF